MLAYGSGGHLCHMWSMAYSTDQQRAYSCPTHLTHHVRQDVGILAKEPGLQYAHETESGPGRPVGPVGFRFRYVLHPFAAKSVQVHRYVLHPFANRHRMPLSHTLPTAGARLQGVAGQSHAGVTREVRAPAAVVGSGPPSIHQPWDLTHRHQSIPHAHLQEAQLL
jgi:hypothetical protein